MTNIVEISIEELKEFQQHELVTEIFGKVDVSDKNFLDLENRILADGEIFEPAIAYDGKYLLAGNKRAKIALAHPEIFKTFRVRVFEGTEQQAMALAVATNVVHTYLGKNIKAIAGARIYNIQKDRFRLKDVTTAKISVVVGVSAELIADADKILNSGNQDCIDAITLGGQSITSIKKMMEVLRDQRLWQQASIDPAFRKQKMAEEEHKKIESKFAAANRNGNNKSEEAIKYGVIYTTFEDTQYMPSDSNCALFMWTKRDRLADAIYGLNEWGFTYRTFYTLVRTNPKASSEVEEVLISAVKGEVVFPKDDIASVQNFIVKNNELPGKYAEEIYRMFPITVKASSFKTRHKGENWSYLYEDEMKDGESSKKVPNISKGRSNGSKKSKSNGASESDGTPGARSETQESSQEEGPSP